MKMIRLVAAVAALLTTSCTSNMATGPAAAPPPEAAATPRAAVQETEPFVIAANPLAAKAGQDVLKRGGSAIDAAIAVQAMLSLVEPQSSGLGGGAFLTYLDGASGKLTIYDGRETAPAQASPSMFLGPDGKPLGYREAVTSGRATGVPGAVAMLAMVHAEHGALDWSSLFSAAERTAEEGFVISPRLGRFLGIAFPQLGTPDATAYFADADGERKTTGDRLKNPEYADFVRRLAANGPGALYGGSTAAKIVAKTRAAPLEGRMTMADLAGYKPVKREALCNPYRVYLVCVPPPPSSGVALLQLLAMLEKTDIATRGPEDAQAWFLFAEASRLMYADRDQYIGDPAFASIPVQGLLEPAYVASRAALIGESAASSPPEAGTPRGAVLAAADKTLEPAGTSHFIVRDAQGNVVSITTTVESIFGSGRMVDGFFLNNQLTDFSFSPVDDNGRPAANAVAPGKRPRSSMTPTILLDSDGKFAGAIGSAGGNSILAYVAKSLVGAIDWDLSMQEALALPNLVARGSRFGGELDKFAPGVADGLAARGVDLKPGQGEDSGVHAVIIRDGRVDGGYDPRREGVVLVGTGE
ncbi:gamma-glutamyltransferase family protein [Parasphingorhabdus flavimaris]|uniref:Gamma-glutamyltransferase family protein n=1 Tax=Parasphingorhabdus flavimaris TaxID=266812 RepID=A0ABX2MY57_9SPHN|nr:gamma-glutamyltransferase family protein [Parasphingorhabdus flavimaris]NVD26379.1 gamma-glutamyltransferase family protein [Parasphingorhabdus flavimaris]